MKAIIYCRKSTDRSDRQQLSIDAQEKEARKIALREWLEVVEVFKETQSAKAPWRPLFNQMMNMFYKWKADCIITWKLNRLARNPIDEWTIKWSMQSWVIKAIFTEWEVFRTWDNVLIMWMHFWMSTQYILDLQRDIKRGQREKIASWWVLQKAPIWYINNRLEKSIEVDPIKSEWVKEIFNLRAQKLALSYISKILFEKWIWNNNWTPFSSSTLETITKNKFYIWLVKFNWEYYTWKYKTFISKKLFDEVNNIYQWLYEYKNAWITYPLKWLIKDTQWHPLNVYTKKWHIYYKAQTKSPICVNISEKKLLEKLEEEFKLYEMEEKFKDLNKRLCLKVLEEWNPEEKQKIKAIEFEISKLKDKKQNLLDLRLEWEISKEVHLERANDLATKINNLENEKQRILGRKDKVKIERGVELAFSLYKRYKAGNLETNSAWLRNNRVELLLNKEKELSLAENSFLKLLKFVNFQNGGAKRNWTAV